jgi:uncharacterized membrane protein
VFDQIGDMPLHPLITHVPVIGIPLALLLSLLFAYPRTQAWARWPLVLTVLGSTAATWVSTVSGRGLYTLLGIEPGNPVGDLIAQHSTLGDQLFYIMLGFSAVAVANVVLVRPARAGDGVVAAAGPRVARPVRILLLAALVAVAVVAFIWTVRVGDLGARAVWNPTGTGLF